MLRLFKCSENRLSENARNLNKEIIKSSCSAKIYCRGLEYYENDLVVDVIIDSEGNHITAAIEGRELYKVNILQEGNWMIADCSCLYEHICKHIVATLLFIEDHAGDIEIKFPVKDPRQYLMSLSKEVLVDIILQSVPSDTIDRLHKHTMNEEEARILYRKVDTEIRKLFSNYKLLNNVSAFEKSLTQSFSKLAGLEHILTKEVGRLLISIISDLCDVIEQGLLSDMYEDEAFETSETFNELALKYINHQPVEDRVVFLNQMDKLLESLPFEVCMGLKFLSAECIRNESPVMLKKIALSKWAALLPHLTGEVYKQIRHLLSETEKKEVLEFLLPEGPDWVIEYASLIAASENVQQGVKALRKWIQTYMGKYSLANVYLLYLDLLQQDGQDISHVAREAIQQSATSELLEKIVNYIPDKAEMFEKLLENKSPTHFFSYLEKHDRYDECILLAKDNKFIWDEVIMNFYIRNKNVVSKDAEIYFCNRIENSLQHTGNQHYYVIADMLGELKQINSILASKIVQDINVAYKRRTKLISILRNMG